MNRVHLFLLSLCIGFCHLTDLHAQNAALAKHLRNYQQFSERFAQEKVYLYFDNENYFIGENIWFKAYVLMADNHHYTSMSKTLYVELLSPNGVVLKQLKLKVENGQAIEMTIIYRDIIHGTRELLSNIIDIRLNNVMKYLAAITIVMAIPNIISGFYGMNVDSRWVPLQSVPFGFTIICVSTVVLCLIVLKVLKKKKML